MVDKLESIWVFSFLVRRWYAFFIGQGC